MNTGSDTTVVHLDNVTKEYIIHHEKPTLVEKLVRTSKFQQEEKFLALDGIKLAIRRGEKVGVMGPNGSGKTTLLKIISGITYPSAGAVRTNGKVVSLIDLEAGFHPDLTGFQNVYINGSILGMKKNEIDSKLKSILRFSGIRQFADIPLFTYSAGMKLRLGFSIAIHAEPDIVIMDEGFMAGDMAFRNKISKKITVMAARKTTIILVSHWQDFVFANVERVIELNHGRIAKDYRIPGK